MGPSLADCREFHSTHTTFRPRRQLLLMCARSHTVLRPTPTFSCMAQTANSYLKLPASNGLVPWKNRIPATGTHEIGKGGSVSHYKSNLRDIEFNLFEVLNTQDYLGKGAFEELDPETAQSILVEVERLCREDLAASYVDGDRN